jgi:transcriptional antiterminator Rof (Rho-off)
MKGIEERIDRCDALDLLEDAVLTKRRLTLVLEGGLHLTGRVTDVVTARGRDEAVLDDGTHVDLSRIVAIS